MSLARTIVIHPGESPASFAARLGAANGVPARDFARDMDFNLPALDMGDEKALQVLSRLAGIGFETLTATTITTRDDGLWLGPEKLGLRNIARNRPRICPVCLQQDLEHGREARREARPWFRVTWTAPFVLTCPVHHCLLLQPPGGILTSSAGLPDALRLNPGWICDGCATAVVGTPQSPLESWLSDRLAGRPTHPGFLDKMPLYLAARFAGMVGATILFGKAVAWRSLSEGDRVRCGAAGFSIAHESPNDFLVSLYAGWSQTKAIGAKGLGGSFMAWLQDNRKNPDFAQLRSYVREHAIDHLPLGPGDDFLGPVTHRTLHSIHSASTEYDVHPKRLRKLLMQNGVVSSNTAHLTDVRVVFRVEAAHDVIASAAEELIGEEAREYLGMNRVQWDQLRKAKLVHTLFGESEETHRAYSRAGLDRFLASVRYEKGAATDNLVPVARAAKLAVCGYVDVVKLLESRVLDHVGVDSSRRGFAGILVDATEVKHKVSKPPLPGLTARQAAKRLGVVLDTVHALTANGDLPSTIQQTYGGKREARLVRHEDVESFLTEYMPLSELAKHLGVEKWPRHACRIMDEEGIAPVFTRETRRSVIYRRADVEAVLAART